MKALLEAKYPTLNADTLLEIASMTPNAELAVEKMCGIYEPYNIPIGEQRFRNDRDKVIYTVTSIDEWHNLVHYSYESEKTKSFYVPSTVDVAGVTLENYKEFECKYDSGNTKYMTLKTGVMEKCSGECSIPDWNQRTLVCE
jgi:hypothetical protein